MNTVIIKIMGLFLSLGLISSCGTSKKTASQSDSTSPTNSALLWKIEKDNLPAPSYLYGTIHIIPSEDFFYPDGTLEAIESTSKMVFEIDMNEMSDMGTQMQLMQKSMMDDGKTLKDLLSEADYKIVSDHFTEMGLPMMMFERMKPAFLTIFASDDMSPQALQSGEMKSYEMEFLELGKTRKMEFGGLETIDYQLSLFDEIPYEDQAKMLVDGIKAGGEGEDQLAEMIAIYKRQDLQGLAAMLTDETVGDMDILLNNRNANWIAPMMKTMNEKPTFFAVGAGHLIGEKGVISLLRKQGYKLTPVLKS